MTDSNGRDRWDNNRLDRLAETVAANSRDIAQLIEATTANAANIDRLTADVATSTANIDRLSVDVAANTANIDRLAAIAQMQQQSLAAIQQGFDIVVQEIRGLRAENRRILSHLFGEDGRE